MNAPNVTNATVDPSARRARLVRERSVADRLGLRPREAYRIAYSSGGVQTRRVTRSIVVFEGASERRRWDGDVASCLDFALPHGRSLSLLASQLIDARPAGLNESGQWVLTGEPGRRRSRRRRRSA